jgi:hypothetical protein
MTGQATESSDLAAMAMVGLTMLLVPLRIVARGYMPVDDVLRHAAFAVTHRTWADIIVGRPEALFDQCPGWHAILRAVHGLTGWGPEGLVSFSIVALFLVFLAAGLPLVRRWESWAVSLGLFFLADGALVKRVTLGRPFILTSIAVLVMLGSSRTRGPRPWFSRLHFLWLGLAALATCTHGSWYLLVMAPGALVLAGRWREALRMGAVVAAGVLLGSTLTGHPVGFLVGQLNHLRYALGQATDPRALVFEFRPGHMTLLPLAVALAAGAAAAWRTRSLRLLKEPLLLLAVLTWGLGYFKVWRFYLDFSFPALALWTAWALDEVLEAVPGRWALALGGCALLAAGTLPNRGGRWSLDGTLGGLNAAIPAQAALLPDPGGVLYSNGMSAFYQTFFLNPAGDWRYILAYEPGMMRPEDRVVYEALFKGGNLAKILAPWVARMTPRDRMLMVGWTEVPPPVPGLHWTRAGFRHWSGRLPRQGE